MESQGITDARIADLAHDAYVLSTDTGMVTELAADTVVRESVFVPDSEQRDAFHRVVDDLKGR